MARGPRTGLKGVVSQKDRDVLESWQRASSTAGGLVRRGRIILLLADGESVSETAIRVGIARRLVYKWAKRFVCGGVTGLHDKPRPGRRPVFSPRGGGPRGAVGVRKA